MRSGDTEAGDEAGLEAGSLDDTGSESVMDAGQQDSALLLYQLVDGCLAGSGRHGSDPLCSLRGMFGY